jgi:hypothetical protein
VSPNWRVFDATISTRNVFKRVHVVSDCISVAFFFLPDLLRMPRSIEPVTCSQLRGGAALVGLSASLSNRLQVVLAILGLTCKYRLSILQIPCAVSRSVLFRSLSHYPILASLLASLSQTFLIHQFQEHLLMRSGCEGGAC